MEANVSGRQALCPMPWLPGRCTQWEAPVGSWGKKERPLRFYYPNSSPGLTDALHCRPQPLSMKLTTSSLCRASLGHNHSQGPLAPGLHSPLSVCCTPTAWAAHPGLICLSGGARAEKCPDRHQQPSEPPLTTVGVKQTLSFYTPSIPFTSRNNPREYILCMHFTEENTGAKKAEMTCPGSYCQ